MVFPERELCSLHNAAQLALEAQLQPDRPDRCQPLILLSSEEAGMYWVKPMFYSGAELPDYIPTARGEASAQCKRALWSF